MFKRFACVVVAFLILFYNCSFNVFANETNISAKSAIVLNADTLSVYYSKNSDIKLSMASTTKIMTAIILCENVRLDEVVKITYEMIAVEGSSMGLAEHDKITYYGLLCGMLLASGNDAANAVAISISGNTENFAELMNSKAKEIGMKNTNFVTASGLDDNNHYSTAYDMALLASYALKNEVIKNIVCKKSVKIEFGNPTKIRTIINHNKLLSIYNNSIGIKTGFTKKSGRCLVSAAKKENTTLICVTLNDPDDWNDHCELYNRCFKMFSEYNLNTYVTLKDIDLVGANILKTELNVEEKSIKATEKDINNLKYKAYIPKYIYANCSNKKIGRVDFYINNKFVTSSDVYIKNTFSVLNKKKSFFEKIFEKFFAIVCF